MIGQADASDIPGGAVGPLSGICVLVTRAPHQAAALAVPLADLGAEVLVAPVIDTIEPEDWGPADEAIADVGGYDWIVLTSVNAVDRFLDRMQARGVPETALSPVHIAVVGPATAERLVERGLTPDLVPDDFRAEGLIEAFRAAGARAGWRVLIPRAEKAREILPETLRAEGVAVDVVPVYRTVAAQPDAVALERLGSGGVDVVTFTSPSTVRYFVEWVEAAGLDSVWVLGHAAAASIGPVTTEALESRGFATPIEALDSTMASLVDAIAAWALESGSTR